MGGQGECERRIEVFVKIQKKIFFFGGGGEVGWGYWSGGRVWGVRVDVNEELKFLGKFTKKNSGAGCRFGAWGCGGSGWGGVRVDVNEELNFCENSEKKNWGVRGGGSGWRGGGQGGCERRIEVFVKIQKKKILGGGRGEGSGWGASGLI